MNLNLKLPTAWDSDDIRDAVLALTVVLLLGASVVWFFWNDHLRQTSRVEVATTHVTAAVATTQRDLTAAVATQTEATHVEIAKTRTRTQRAVDEIREAVASPVGDPDRAFYVGVCKSPFYQGAAECVSYRGGPEGDHSAPGA
jgi:hypothetical protein